MQLIFPTRYTDQVGKLTWLITPSLNVSMVDISVGHCSFRAHLQYWSTFSCVQNWRLLFVNCDVKGRVGQCSCNITVRTWYIRNVNLKFKFYSLSNCFSPKLLFSIKLSEFDVNTVSCPGWLKAVFLSKAVLDKMRMEVVHYWKERIGNYVADILDLNDRTPQSQICHIPLCVLPTDYSFMCRKRMYNLLQSTPLKIRYFSFFKLWYIKFNILGDLMVHFETRAAVYNILVFECVIFLAAFIGEKKIVF